MAGRVKRAGNLVEFRINYHILACLGNFYNQNKYRFANDELKARQYLFNEGISYVNSGKDPVIVPRTVAHRREFLDPKNKSVQIVVDDEAKSVLRDVAMLERSLTQQEAAPVVMKIGYDCQP